MILTNKLNLPLTLVAAVTAGEEAEYRTGDKELRVTELLSPAQIVHLQKKHSEEITVDAADMIWAALGRAFHNMMEVGEKRASVITEQRLKIEVSGWVITGKFDNFEVMVVDEGGVLTDWKLTNVYKYLSGSGVKDWTPQLNVYAYMLRKSGYIVERLQVGALFRDWKKSEAKRDPLYPKHQFQTVEIEMWDDAKTESFIKERVAYHAAARAGQVPKCSDEERWVRPGKWALHREGVAKAMKLGDSILELEIWGSGKYFVDGAWKKGFELKFRPPEAQRCADYCPVAGFCDQWKGDPMNKKETDLFR